jgi:isorenieratene synthase
LRKSEPGGRKHSWLTRRGFLKSTALGTAGIAAAGTGTAYLGRARPELVVEPEPHLPRSLAPGSAARRVLVVGGGLAGLSSAIELAERGFEVELFEAGAECGGRAGGFRTRIGGKELSLDHGFHGFFFQYYNLRDLLGRAADLSDFLPLDAYPLAPKNRPVDVFSASRLPLPFNLFKVMAESENLSLVSALSGGMGQMLEMLSYDPTATFERLDGIDFESWAREMRVPKSFYDHLFKPYVRTMFVRPDEVSAAEIIQLFHSFFLANPEGLGMDVLQRPFLEGLIYPLVAHFQALGGRVHTAAPVHALHIEEGALRGVVRKVAGEPRRVARFALADLPAGGFREVETDVGLAFARRGGTGVEALNARCPHMGCTVGLSAASDGFLCPCHGGRFDEGGSPIAGPPKEPLERLPASVIGGEVTLRSRLASKVEVVAADYVILATDVGGVHAIHRNTIWPGAVRQWAQQLKQLRVCRPYSVARQWLDRPLSEDRHALYAAGGYEVLDELFCLSQYHGQEMEWARRNGGSVIETHCYALKDELVSDPEHVHDTALAESISILPELAQSRVVHRDVQLLENATDYPVNGQARRPRTETPFANLQLAGDWVRIDLPLELMERATVSGRLAANRILARERLQRVAIKTPPVRGILA